MGSANTNRSAAPRAAAWQCLDRNAHVANPLVLPEWPGESDGRMHKLIQHPSGQHNLAIEAGCTRGIGASICLEIEILNGADQLSIPDPGLALRQDGLWNSTCFELFARPTGQSAYRELNLAPSAGWAAYAFSAYRSGHQVDELAHLIDFDAKRSRIAFRIRAEFLIPALATIAQGQLDIGLSAVIESRDGSKSFWALAHPAGAPDFHHDAAFVAAL